MQFFNFIGMYSGGFVDTPPPITSNLRLYVNPEEGVYSDASQTKAINGDYVRQIYDQSGNNVILNQTAGSNQYTFDTGTLGSGNSALYIGDSTKFMEFDSTITISGSSESMTFYSAYLRTNNSSLNYIYGTSSGNFDRILQFTNNEIYFQDNTGLSSNATSSRALSLVIKAYSLNTSNDTITTYLNGSLVDTVTQSKAWGDFDFSRFWGQNGMTGYVGKTLLYADAHNATEIGQVSDWLNDKYSIY